MLVTNSNASPSSADRAHLEAAQKLVLEVQRDYLRLLREKEALEDVFMKWGRLMKAFRVFERESVFVSGATSEIMSMHKEVMNIMIFCATCIAVAGEMHLAENFHLQNGERGGLAEKLETVKRHSTLLKFEFGHCHGPAPTKEQIEAAEKGQRVSSGNPAYALRRIQGVRRRRPGKVGPSSEIRGATRLAGAERFQRPDGA